MDASYTFLSCPPSASRRICLPWVSVERCDMGDKTSLLDPPIVNNFNHLPQGFSQVPDQSLFGWVTIPSPTPFGGSDGGYLGWQTWSLPTAAHMKGANGWIQERIETLAGSRGASHNTIPGKVRKSILQVKGAAQIQEALHHRGIHSTTSQSEYATPGIAPVKKVRLWSLLGALARPSD